MNKKTSVAVMVAIVFCAGFFSFALERANAPDMSVIPQAPSSADSIFNSRNATFEVEGNTVTLRDGVSEVDAAPGSASKVVTRYFGNEVRHDFDGDGREDVAFLVTRQTGGSGTFFYIVVALNTAEGQKGSDALFLGDRIAPQPTVMGKGNVVVVNYAVRAEGESFAVPPSIGVSRWLLLDPQTMRWGEVARDFEGEASPEVMTLDMKTWQWAYAEYNNDTVITPRAADRFALTFKKDGTFSASTDCNGVGGTYATTPGAISFTQMMSTEMYCDGSQEDDFKKVLSETRGYHFNSRGQLILELRFDSGVAVFR